MSSSSNCIFPSSILITHRPVLQNIIMCEQIIQYDCGHLSRKRIPCAARKQHRRHSSAPSSFSCFSALASHSTAIDDDCTRREKTLQRCAMLCRACRAEKREKEVYSNIERVQTTALCEATNRAVSMSRSSETATRHAPPKPKYLVTQKAQKSHHGHQNSLSSPSNAPQNLEPTHQARAPRPQNILISHPSIVMEAIPNPTLEISKRASQSSHRSRHVRNVSSQSGDSRRDSTLHKFRRDIRAGLHIQANDSDESLVCATARGIEKK